MRKIESYGSPEQVKERILQLREEGVSEDAITVVAKEGLHDTAFNDYDVNFKKAEGSAWDKFVSFFTGEDSEDRVVEDLDLSKDEEAQYKRELEDGGILLYVNDYESRDGNLNHTPQATAGAYYANDENPEEDRMMDRDNRFAEDADGVTHRDPLTDRANNATRDEGAYGQDTMDEKEHAYNDRVNDNNVDEETIELQEERLNVNKERVRSGEVDVSKHVETDRQEFDVPVEREEVTIERREVDDRPADGNFNDNDEIRIPVNEERVNVTKENVVGEEVVIKKETVQDTEHVSEDVRREEVDVEESYQDRNQGDNRNTDYTDTEFERESKSDRIRDDEIVDDARNNVNDRL